MSRPKGTKRPTKEWLSNLYWNDFLNFEEIWNKWNEKNKEKRPRLSGVRWIGNLFKEYGITQRSKSEHSSLWQLKNKFPKKGNRFIDKRRPYCQIYEDYYGISIPNGYHIHHKDMVNQNDHPLNLELTTIGEHTKTHIKLRTKWNEKSIPKRIPIYEVFMRLTESLSKLSHHHTTKVGSIIVSFDLEQIFGIGYSGNAKGLKNEIDSDIPGMSQTLHAEENALLKSGKLSQKAIMFSTHSPCLMCVKRIINSNISDVYFRKFYRDKTPLGILRYMGIRVCKYDKYKNLKFN